jgi:ribosomal subunit interface protein
MSFPSIQFKATNIYIEGKWRDAVQQKFATLSKFIGNKPEATCHVEFEKLGSHHTGPIYRIDVSLFAHGKVFRADTLQESFEVAIDKVHQELTQELSKAHSKRDTLVRRGRRKIKEMLRWGS